MEGETTNTAHYDAIEITSSSTAEIILNVNNNQDILLDIDSNDVFDSTISPSSILDANQSQDLTPPGSTSTLSGTVGQPGTYRSNVIITFLATDPVIDADPSKTSGVLKTQFNLNNSGYLNYSYEHPNCCYSRGFA